jgi:hypothetical protein
MKSKRMRRWAKRVARMGEVMNLYTFLSKNLKRRNCLEGLVIDGG